VVIPLSPTEIITRTGVHSWRYNQTLPLGDKIHYGVLAQDVLKTFGSEYNFIDESGKYLKVNYYEFIGPLIAHAQQLQQRAEQQEQRIAALEQVINTIIHKEQT
jgi:hypothetical protein